MFFPLTTMPGTGTTKDENDLLDLFSYKILWFKIDYLSTYLFIYLCSHCQVLFVDIYTWRWYWI